MSTIESGKKLDKLKCESENAGDLVFVKDYAEVYFCDGEEWLPMKGEDGEKGDKGDKGEKRFFMTIVLFCTKIGIFFRKKIVYL